MTISAARIAAIALRPASNAGRLRIAMRNRSCADARACRTAQDELVSQHNAKNIKGRIEMKLLTISAALVTAAIATGAFAQDYPSRPITYVVPFPPGGVTDNGARTIAKVLSEKIGQTVIVENKPGAGGIVGAEYVSQAKPDGYTFMYTSSGPVGAFAYRYKKLSFDPFTAFVPVHGMAYSPMIAVVNASAPYKTFKELIEYAKKNPEGVNYYSTGPGSSNHLVSELLDEGRRVQDDAGAVQGHRRRR